MQQAILCLIRTKQSDLSMALKFWKELMENMLYQSHHIQAMLTLN